MPTKVTTYRILIEAPDGLDEEQRALSKAVHNFNDQIAFPRDVFFVPGSWCSSVGGPVAVERLQPRDLRTVDVLLLVLWDRIPAGVEREWQLAQEAVRAGKLLMAVPFFKSVSSRTLTDPGPQLEALLTFRSRLESDPRVVTEGFDGVEQLTDRLRFYLSGWLLDHERGRPGPPPGPPKMLPEDEPEPLDEPEPQPVGGAPNLQHLQEQIESEGTTPTLPDDRDLFATARSINEHGQQMLRDGDLEQAQTLHEEAAEKAQNDDCEAQLAVAHGSLGVICQIHGELVEAEAHFNRALKIFEELGLSEGAAACYVNLGLVHRRRKRPQKAQEMFDRAMMIEREELGRPEGIVECYDQLADLYADRGEFYRADQLKRERASLAKDIRRQNPYPFGDLFPTEFD